MIESDPGQISLEQRLAEHVRPPMQWSEPLGFDLSDAGSRRELEARFDAGDVHTVCDPIDAIAGELFELEHPDQASDDTRRAEFVQHITDQGPDYGTWFLMPWSKELVRYPDVAEHRALHTSRHRNLITDNEQARLYDATVAVIGLSVGSNVVESVVRSGIGGKIIMGDPDVVSPTNLNRINVGFADVGTSKIDLAARKISEIDPYIDQVHFRQGVTHANMQELAGHRPDIIFDEVDDLSMKASLRKLAKEIAAPLVMATDLGDVSIIDVERHDLENIQPFNGRLKPQEIERLDAGTLDAAERRKLMLKIVGIRHVTTRLLDSALQVDKSLAGLPQLGTTAAVGGSYAAIAAREIILGRQLPSGRYVSSPKNTLGLKADAGVVDTLRTLKVFVKSRSSS